MRLEQDAVADEVCATDDSDNDNEERDSDIEMEEAADDSKRSGGISAGAIWFQCATRGCGKWRKAAHTFALHPSECASLRDTTCQQACDYCGAISKGDCDSLCSARTVSA
jgi:hypothetical protein